jgi:hypothetical protein
VVLTCVAEKVTSKRSPADISSGGAARFSDG